MSYYRTKRIKAVSNFTVGLFAFIVLFVLGTTVKNMSQPVEEELIPFEPVEQEYALAGDILDCNGNVIVSASRQDDGTQQLTYRHAYAYTLFVGSTDTPDGDDSDQDPTYGIYDLWGDELYSNLPGEEKGASVQLTIDGNLQEYAYEKLSATGKKGSIVIMEAKTGKVKACVFTPSIDGNQLEPGWESELSEAGGHVYPLTNPVVPGSIYKIVTSAGVLEQGLEEVVVSDNGELDLGGGKTLPNYNSNAYGNLSLKDGFRHSSNVYFGTMGRDYLKETVLEDLAERFQIGKTLKFDFGTVKSTITMGEESSSLAWLAIGQGGSGSEVKLSPMNAAMVVQTVANNGEMLEPYAVEKIFYQREDGETTLHKGQTKSFKQVLNTSVAKDLQEIMKYTGEYYTEKQTGKKTITVNDQEISIGMKTGTGEYLENGKKTNSIWIASMAPADQPEYIVVMNLTGSAQTGSSLLKDIIALTKETLGSGE